MKTLTIAVAAIIILGVLFVPESYQTALKSRYEAFQEGREARARREFVSWCVRRGNSYAFDVRHPDGWCRDPEGNAISDPSATPKVIAEPARKPVGP